MTDEEYHIWIEYVPEEEFRELTNLAMENDKIRIREEREKVMNYLIKIDEMKEISFKLIFIFFILGKRTSQKREK
jgi:phage anti-repressor protein